jgi:hypothetical protein
MALRVARGLFRLWLVLSVLWIGGVGYVTWRDFPQEWVASEGEPPDWAKSVKPGPEVTDPELLKLLNTPIAELRRSVIWHASLLAFLPPAFMLALGSALVWALRGFR